MPRSSFWDKWGFTLAIILSLIFFILLALYRSRVPTSTGTDPVISLIRPIKSKKPGIKKIYETRCREIFESIFHRPFPTVRPQFLKRSNGSCLELDGYNSELKLGFEYQGRQHYSYITLFHKRMEDFEAQKQRDTDKRALCRANGITVIEIPYTIKYDRLESYIRQELRKIL